MYIHYNQVLWSGYHGSGLKPGLRRLPKPSSVLRGLHPWSAHLDGPVKSLTILCHPECERPHPAEQNGKSIYLTHKFITEIHLRVCSQHMGQFRFKNEALKRGSVFRVPIRIPNYLGFGFVIMGEGRKRTKMDKGTRSKGGEALSHGIVLMPFGKREHVSPPQKMLHALSYPLWRPLWWGLFQQ